MIIVTSSVFSEKLRLQLKCFSFTRNRNPAFSNSSGLKVGFEKPRFCNGVVWTIGLTVEINLRFLNFSCLVWTGHDVTYNAITALLKDDTPCFFTLLSTIRGEERWLTTNEIKL